MIKIRQQLMLLVLSCFSLQLMLMDPLYLDKVQITLAKVTTLVRTTICKLSLALSLSQGWQCTLVSKVRERCKILSQTTRTMLPSLNSKNNNNNSANNNINNKAPLYQNKPPPIPTIPYLLQKFHQAMAARLSFDFSKQLAIILPIHCESER